GFLSHLSEIGFGPAGCTAIILGSGGSARAVAYALVSKGAKVVVCGRNAETSAALVERLLALCYKEPPETCTLQGLPELDSHVDMIINTTPLGMVPQINSSPWPEGVRFPGCRLAYDLVYNPPRTRFIEQALATGIE